MIGYKFFNINNFFWKKHQRGIIALSPPHISSNLDVKKAYEIINKNGALFIRWEENFDNSLCKSWWHIVKNGTEDISTYDRKTRSLIRKAKKLNNIKQCKREQLISIAYPVYKKTFESYDTHEKIQDKKEFQENISSLPEETEFWGVFTKDDNKLIAFSENLVMDDVCFYNTMWLTPEAKQKSASFLLFHGMNEYYLNKKKLKYVTAGAKSISHKTNIQDFLQKRFKFRKAYSDINVVYKKWLFILVVFLFPLRKFFQGSSVKLLQQLGSLLEQEKIRRQCKKAKTRKQS